jgi:hypothetical protein
MLIRAPSLTRTKTFTNRVKNMIAQGVDATQRQGDVKKINIVDQFKKKYAIPIDFELYSDHAPFYPFAINQDFVR